MIPDKPKSFLDTLPKLSEADLELDVQFQTRFGGAPAVVINDGSLVDSTEGERLYHKHRKNVVKCGDLLWLLSPATAQWWWIFWRQVERIGYENIADARIAHIELFHDAQHASRLSLPLAAARETAGQ